MAKRLGIYIYNGAEVIDWAGPVGVFAVARRLDPELDAFLVGDSLSPITATGNLTVHPRYCLDQKPDMDAFLIPGGIGSRAEMHNGRLIAFVKGLPDQTLLVSVCTGSWVYGTAGLLDGLKVPIMETPSTGLIVFRLAGIFAGFVAVFFTVVFPRGFATGFRSAAFLPTSDWTSVAFSTFSAMASTIFPSDWMVSDRDFTKASNSFNGSLSFLMFGVQDCGLCLLFYC